MDLPIEVLKKGVGDSVVGHEGEVIGDSRRAAHFEGYSS